MFTQLFEAIYLEGWYQRWSTVAAEFGDSMTRARFLSVAHSMTRARFAVK